MLLSNDTAKADITNNIIWGNTIGIGTCKDIYIDSNYDGNSSHATVILKNNDFNKTTGFCTTNSSFTIDPSNLNTNPQFVDAPNENYHLLNTSPVINKTALVKYGKKSRNTAIITGTTPNFAAVREWKVEKGRFIGKSDLVSNRKVCVLGYSVYQDLFRGVDPIGRKLVVNGRNWGVGIGIGNDRRRNRIAGVH